MKICIASSAGGHLTEIKQLEEVYKKTEHFFLTVRRSDTVELSKRKRVFFVDDNSVIDLPSNFLASWKILLREKPDILISTGARTAMPAIIVAKILGTKVIFLESLARVRDLSLSGKIAYIISDIFLVQWPELLKEYPRAKYWGAVV
ncbi:MAG TPA: PssD/Cps14F family polysaccharide biosynthesis glycosyltransferase [archaeon]|nr:PssD/Cps14F family polysaccharide biosynthesis glycosyltransferase [archaeon]